VIEQRDWTPKGDLTLEMEPTGSAPLISGLRCPAVQEVLSRAALWLAALDRVEPLPFVRLSDEELRRCRALPRAIHGATFEDAELSAFFYEPRPIGASQKLFVSRANPGFDPSMLTAEEWLYVHVLTQVELARAARVRSVTAE